jgi:hypothetical protein
MTNKNLEEKSKTKRKRMVQAFWKDRPAVLLSVLTIALAFVFVGLLPRFIGGELGIREQLTGISEQEEAMYRHPVTGLPLFEEVEDLQVFGVMIDNHFDAWPPSGIDEAILVVEAPVEAGISRMIAFFDETQEIGLIGPVRSARPYYLDWNNELDALLTHVGGSNAALDLIASGGTFDLNQYWLSEYFWRSTQRYAPHNVYTSTEKLNAYVLNREEAGRAPELLYGIWKFKDADFEGESAVGVRIDFAPPVYVVDWEFDLESRQYLRSQANEAHTTDANVQIAADNVAIVITDVIIIDGVGRRSIDTIGEGEAYVLQDGVVIEGAWKKPSATERLRFYNDEDVEIEMNAGRTWIEVVGDLEAVVF